MQRGSNFFLSKISFSQRKRTKSAFDATAEIASNSWIIPLVVERWNQLMTGDPHKNYKQYLVEQYFSQSSGLKLLSLGSGDCSHELELARYHQFDEIICIDLAENRLNQARAIAEAEGLNNIHFLCIDLDDYEFKQNYFDLVLFNASLHHFENVHDLLRTKVKPTLKNGGYLIINEYVGPKRLQFPNKQLKAVNQALKLIDKPFRKRYKTNLYKNRFSGSGVIRMIIADPSECVDSNNILPAIHANFNTVEENAFGGNIIVNALKDIAHHFVELDNHKKEILEKLFHFEDKYLEENPSDFIFGIYEKP